MEHHALLRKKSKKKGDEQMRESGVYEIHVID
jgi:hypothetical protein